MRQHRQYETGPLSWFQAELDRATLDDATDHHDGGTPIPLPGDAAERLKGLGVDLTGIPIKGQPNEDPGATKEGSGQPAVTPRERCVHTIPAWCHDGDWYCVKCNKVWLSHTELMADAGESCSHLNASDIAGGKDEDVQDAR